MFNILRTVLIVLNHFLQVKGNVYKTDTKLKGNQSQLVWNFAQNFGVIIIGIDNHIGVSKLRIKSRKFSEVAETAQVAQGRGQFHQLLKTNVIVIINFMRIQCYC